MFYSTTIFAPVKPRELDLPVLSWLLLSAEACAIRRWSSKRGLKGFLRAVWVRGFPEGFA